MYKILYVEDEIYLAKIVKDSLIRNGYEVKHVINGANAIPKFKSFEPDICLLDIMLPFKNGYEIANEIRLLDKNIPIIFLTAKNQENDLIAGFESGGNDYINKPFSMKELIVRIENLRQLTSLKPKSNDISLQEIKIGETFTFHPIKYLLIGPNFSKTLSYKESMILSTLCQSINGITNRKELLLKVWGDDSYYNSRNLDVYIRKLRKYFSTDKNICIKTLKAVGYSFQT